MQNYSYALYPDELYHYGVKDMHWGVRNYQNKDGSLTALGRIHYGIEGMYNGPKMEHLKSQVARGWATANDPEFLGRKMSDVYQKVGRAAELAKRKDFWNHDLNTIAPYIRNWMNPEQYNVSDVSGVTTADYNKSPNADVTIDWSGAKVGGYANKVLKTNSPGMAYVDPDKLEFGNMLINVYQGYQDAKNVKMSDLAEFSVKQKFAKGTKQTDRLGVTTQERISIINQPIETTIGAINYDPRNIDTNTGKQILKDRVVTRVDDRLEQKYAGQIRKRAEELYKTPTVSPQEAAKNKATQLSLQQSILSSVLSPEQRKQAMDTINSLQTTTIDDVDSYVKQMKESKLQDYQSWASMRDATVNLRNADTEKFNKLLKAYETYWS